VSIFALGKKIEWGDFLESDLKEASLKSFSSLSALSKAEVLIVGAGGFVGSWISAVLIYAKDQYRFDYGITLTYQNAAKISKILNLTELKYVKIIEGDLKVVANEILNSQLNFSHVIHAATPTSMNFQMIDNEYILDGTSKLINEVSARIKPNFIHLSSGAIYGLPARQIATISEIQSHSPVNLENWEYAKCKRGIEELVVKGSKDGKLNGSNPRLFSFIGPHFPINNTFAIGEFVSKAIEKKKIIVNGSLASTRSYMYPTDMVAWILSILVKPTIEATHVGSEYAIQMMQLAETVNYVFEGVGVDSIKSTDLPNYYVPQTIQTRQKYNLNEFVSLNQGLERWKSWLKSD
jgi:dTDP-glucose 4,6-dehydratase